MKKKRLVFYLSLVAILLVNIGSSRADDNNELLILRKYYALGDTGGLKKVYGLLNDGFQHYTANEYGDALDQCIARATKDHSPLIKDFHTLKAKWFRFNNNIPASAAEYSKVYDYLIKANKENEGIWILIDIGNLFFATENYEEASVFYKKASNLSDKLKDAYALSVINLNLALISTANENYPSAISYLKECIKLRQGTKESAFISHSYIKLSEVYSMMNKMDSVLFYIKAAEQVYYSEGEHVGALENMPALIGMAYYKYFTGVNNSRIAAIYLQKAREYIRLKKLEGRLFESYLTEAEFQLDAGNSQLVVDSLSSILPVLEKSPYYDFYVESLHLLAKASSDVGSYDASRQYYEKYISALKNDDKQKYRANSAVAGILQKSPKSEKQASEVKQDKKDPFRTLLIILSAGCIAVLIFQRSRLSEQKKRNSELKRELERQKSDFDDKLRRRTGNVS